MHSLNFILTSVVATLAVKAVAFRVPEGTPDGFYRAYMKDGVEIHEPVSPVDMKAVNTDNKTVATVQPRYDSDWSTWCGCGWDVNPADTDAAVADLMYQLRDRQYIPTGQAFYSIRGSVVAFDCSLGFGMTEDSSNVARAISKVKERCGSYTAGTAHFASTDRWGNWIGYMRSPVQDFCAGSTTSPADHC